MLSRTQFYDQLLMSRMFAKFKKVLYMEYPCPFYDVIILERIRLFGQKA